VTGIAAGRRPEGPRPAPAARRRRLDGFELGALVVLAAVSVTGLWERRRS
jgi:hypothetical protein